jgi:hypothetical protein
VIENNAAGLVLLAGEVTVAVTREEYHQRALARYTVAPGGERHVAVELGWCVIGAGKYRGERAVEVRLDGQRIGELTYLMSQRYGGMLRQVPGRPGCTAIVRRGAKGLEVVLRLPRADSAAPVFAAAPSLPAAAPTPSGQSTDRLKKVWVAVIVVAVVMVFAAIFGGEDDSPTTAEPGDSAATTTESATFEQVEPTETTEPTTETTTTTTTVAPKPKPKPKPKPVAPKPAAPAPKPKPAANCDPNYTGCVPVASDVDCAGGSGNGPAYVSGPVEVIGDDVYGLDRDGDGTACE